MIYTRENAVADLLLIAGSKIYGLTVWDCIRELPDTDPFEAIRIFAGAWVALKAASFTSPAPEDYEIHARPNFPALEVIWTLHRKRFFSA